MCIKLVVDAIFEWRESMLRENKPLIIKGIIFLGILIFGAVMLLSNRSGHDEPVYNEEPSNEDSAQTEDLPPSEPTPEPYEYPPTPPPRQPITTVAGPFICTCPEDNSRPWPALAPPRPRAEPVRIASFHSPDGSSQLLLETDGTLWAWGGNWRGQLGDGTLRSRGAPVQILDSVVYVAPMGYMAIKDDGSLWGWGVEPLEEGPAWTGLEIPHTPRWLMDDVARIFQSDTRDFVLRTDGSLWALGPNRFFAPRWSSSSFMMPGPGMLLEVNPAHILDSVVDVFFAQMFAFALQCNGRLWSVVEDMALHAMDEVVSVHPINDFTTGAGYRALALQTDGTLWSLSATVGGTPREPVFVMENVASVYETQNNSAFILQQDGSLWGIGNNNSFQLGDGSRAYRSVPVRIMDDVVSVYPQWNNTFAILTDGSLWAWGSLWDYSSTGQPWDNITTNHQYPVHIMDGVRSVYFDWSNTYIIGADSSLWIWGPSIHGGLGFVAEDGTVSEIEIDGPGPVRILEDITEVFSFGSDVFALGADGSLWTWQWRWFNWNNEPQGGAPIRHVLDEVAYVVTTHSNLHAVQADGSIWALGQAGQVGDGAWVHRSNIVNISYAFSYAQWHSPVFFGNTTVEAIPLAHQPLPFIASGGLADFLIDSNGRLWAWGENWDGQLGRGLPHYAIHHSRAPGLVMDNIAYVHPSINNVTHAIGADGRLWVWGHGHGISPVYVLSNVAAFYSENHAFFALRTDGTLWSWRDLSATHWPVWWESRGAYPEEANIDFSQPTQILSQVQGFYIESGTIFAHKTDGSLWSWGFNPMGLLGDGTQESWLGPDTLHFHASPVESGARLTPVQIMEDVARFYTVGPSAFAIKTNGTLWAWGDNSQGQLGDGTRISRNTPVLIMDGVQHIYGDEGSIFATRADNSLWAWGWNALGQLGTGNKVSRLYPVRIMEATSEIFIKAGTTYAILPDNSLWAWGVAHGPTPTHIMDNVETVYVDDRTTNHFAQQLNGNLWQIGITAQAHELIMENVVLMHNAHGTFYVVDTYGEVRGWGSNWSGRLGESFEDVTRDSPVQIIFEE